MSALARASVERMARHGIRPNRELGQNFLVDDNILDVIGRTAELSPDNVVLEIGGGLGVLSEYLVQRVAHLHVIESDARLEPVLAEALEGRSGATIVLADVMDADLRNLDPAPGKVVHKRLRYDSRQNQERRESHYVSSNACADTSAVNRNL